MRRHYGAGFFGLWLASAFVVSGCSSTSGTERQSLPWHAAAATTVQAVTSIPKAVFDAVGLVATVTPPVLLKSQPALSFDGKPGVYYLGSEPCPLCAAERWAFIAATSRFGSWSNLGIAQSAGNDEFPNTQTFTFVRSSFSSRYVTVRTVELLSSHQFPNGRYPVLQHATAEEAAVNAKYDSAAYFPSNPGTLPFMDFGNRVVVAGPSYDPGVLAGLSRAQIASDLTDPTSAVTKGIVGTANYLAAAICSIDGEQPTSVCASSGVAQVRNVGANKVGSSGCPANPHAGSSVCGEGGSVTRQRSSHRNDPGNRRSPRMVWHVRASETEDAEPAT